MYKRQGLKGDREERRQALQAAVRRADAQIAELQAQIDDLQVRAPVNGEVGPIPAEQGELINAYSPLLTLVRLDDSYFVFNLREDILALSLIHICPESSLSPPGCTLRRRADVYLRTCLGLGLARFGPGGRRLCREKL